MPNISTSSGVSGLHVVLSWFGCADHASENNINGENLMEMDQSDLKDMGVKKIGDRVRIGSQAKLFRNREYKRTSKRNTNRVSD